MPLKTEDFFMRTRVKICGITRIEDAQFAVDAGVGWCFMQEAHVL